MSHKRLLAIAACCSLLSGCGANEPVNLPQEPVTTTKAAVVTTVAATASTTASVTQAQTTVTTVPTTVAQPAVPPPAVADDVMVRVRDYIPDVVVELKYATTDNFTGQVIYDFADAYLRYGTVKKLKTAQEDLQRLGLGLKIWDGFRPVSAQFTLWEVYPDPSFVADPRNGYSSHSRGNTVDVTLVDAAGKEVQMPTAFDDFSSRADRDYSDCDEESAANALLLESTMRSVGFKPYSAEWWHFSDERSYPVETEWEP